MSTKPKVLVSVPNQGWLHKHCVFALMKMQQDSRVSSKFILPTHKPYVNCLHKIMNDFLSGDFDYWISFDDDNPPRNNPFDLVFLEKDIIGCPTPVWHNSIKGDHPIYWNALDSYNGGFKPHKEKKGLQKVDAIGSGCLIIKRKVMESLRLEKPFMRIWKENGEVDIGGDFSFCQKVKKAGFEIYAHFGYPCYHFNEIEIGEIGTAFMEIKNG